MAQGVGRKTITVPATGTGGSHKPERLVDQQGVMAVRAEFFTLPGNTGRVYIGWAGTSAIPGMEIGIPVLAGDVTTIQNPQLDDDGKLQPFDLYDLWLSGTVDGNGVTWFTW